MFEDQRSGETLGRLQKVRTDVEKLIRDQHQRAVHLAGRHRLRDDLRLHRALDHRAGLLPDGADARRAQLGAEQADQADPEGHRRRDDGAGRLDHRVAAQHRAGEEPGPRAAGNRPPQRHDRQDPEAGAEEGPLPAQPELHPGHLGQPAAHQHHVPDALPDLHARDHRRPVLLAVHLLVLHLRAAAGTRQRHQRLPRDRSVAERLRDDPADSEGAEARATRCRSRPADAGVRCTSAFSTSRRSSPAVSDISFGAERGETIAFVGPSGAGKTTLVKLLVGLYQPRQGRILYNGIARHRDRPRRPARAHRLRHPGHPALLGHDSREPAVRQSGGDRRRVPRRAARRRRATTCWRGPIAVSTR